MKKMSIVKILLVSFCLALVGRYGFLEIEALQEKGLTAELCRAVGNYLETGAIRDAYENLQASVSRLGHGNACVSVLDQGRSYSTNCVNPTQSYNATLCRAESNAGVSAQVLYPKAAFFNFAWIQAWIFLTLLLIGFSAISKLAASSIVRLVTDELKQSIFQKTPDKKSVTREAASFLLQKIGVTDVVRQQTEQFQNELKVFEENEREALALRARAEARAEKSQEYIEAVRQVRHDIRSPLSSLMAVRSELKANNEIEAALSYSITSIEKLVDRLGEKDGGGSPRLSVAEVLLEETIGSLAVKFRKAKGVTLSLRYQKEKLSPINVVPLDFQRVIENLLENAFDAVGVGGSIFVTVTSEGASCSISVEDNGSGVPVAARAQIFTDGATFGKVNGGGRGLSFVKSRIEAWDGRVSYAPIELGSRFEISLPIIQTGLAFVGALEPTRIFVVDDDSTVPQTLEKNGFEIVDAAANLEEGRQIFKAHSKKGYPILVDENLGDGSRGTDLIREFGATRETYLCTNDYDDPETIRRAKALGVRIIPKSLSLLSIARGGTS